MPTSPMPYLAENTPATGIDAPRIRNGVFSVTYANQNRTFKIHTIRQARTRDLIGKRVISVFDDGDFRTFAFVTQASTLKLWQRYQSHADEQYVTLAKLLLETLGNHTAQYAVASGTFIESGVTVEHNIGCQDCNGRLFPEYLERGSCDRCGGRIYRAPTPAPEPAPSIRRRPITYNDLDDDESVAANGRQPTLRGVADGVPASVQRRIRRSQITPSEIQ